MNTGWHPARYSVLALRGLVQGSGLAAGFRVLVSDE